MKTLIILVLLFPSPYKHIHSWIKSAEWRADDGKVVCTWECYGDHFNVHTTTTAAFGACPYPIR